MSEKKKQKKKVRTAMEPPQILRIKRKRGQDPLQALILEDRELVKRSKPSSPVSSGAITPVEDSTNFYFKLARTDETNNTDLLILGSILAETSKETSNRSFVIPKAQEPEDIVIPHELSDMVRDFVINNDTPTPQRKKRHGSVLPQPGSSEESKPEDDEYVYDVYQLSTVTDQNHPKSQIGYIRFFESDDEEFNGSEASVDKPIYSDNEDSNAEDYYQNDYPEDEDADIAEDVHTEYDDTGLEVDQEQFNDLYDYVQQNNVKLVDNDYNSADDADFIFDGDDDDDDDDDYDSDEEDFPRQKFFDNESDDELAKHRDKIFGKLQKMIDEE